MSDLDRRARRLVGGWPSGGLVVGLLPDSSSRNWSGKAALELAAAAAQERLAALVLDLAPDASDLADRFGADPEPGFAQVMTGEVELSQIQHWDAGRGAYYLPGGVRVLSDKVAKSRSVEALAKRVKGQEGILFVLLDRHAAEAAAEAGWLDGVVRLGQADLGGPKMFSDVTALGHLEQLETVQKPWERERRGAPDSATGSAEPEPEPADAGPEPSVEPTESAAADRGDGADLTVEADQPAGPQPSETRPAAEETAGTPETRPPAETEEPLEPAASTEAEIGDETADPSEPELPGESAEPAADGPATAVEVSEEGWQPRETTRTGVLDPSDAQDGAADGSEPPELEVVDASEEEPAGEPPVLEVPAEVWDPREAGGDRGVTEEPEIAAESDELEPGDEAEEVVEADEPVGPETAGAAEVEDTEEPALPEVEDEEAPAEEVSAPEGEKGAEVEEQEAAETDVAEEPEVAEAGAAAGAETGGAEIEDAEEPAVPEVEDEEVVSEEVGGAEVGAEPEITEEPGEAPGDEARKVEEAGETAPSEEAGEKDAVDEESGEPEITGEPELSEAPEDTKAQEPDETRLAEEAPEAEVEEPAAEELDRPAGLERFAEIPEDSTEAEPSPEVEEAGETEEVSPAAEADDEIADEEGEVLETAAKTAEGPADDIGDAEVDEEEADESPPEIEAAGEEDDEDDESDEPVHTEVITSGLDVWPAEADQRPSRGEPAETGAAPHAGAEDDGGTPEPTESSVIAAALWSRPEENGGSAEPVEATEREDFITAAMWASEGSGDEETAAREAGGSVIVSRDGWAPAAGTAETEESATVVDDAADVDEPAAPDAATDDEDADEVTDSGEPERADFILDGLELPPEWSEEWEEEERAATGTAELEEADDDSSSDEAGEGGKADFVTQGMGIPDDEGKNDDPWPDSGTSTDWSRDSGQSSGTWERDPYGSSTGRAAAATAGQPERQGLALSRRGQGGGELWRKARTAAIVLLTVGSLGVFGSAVIDSGTLSAIGDVAATAVSGLGAGGSGDDGASGDVAAAGAGGSGAAAAAVDSTPPTPDPDGEETPGTDTWDAGSADSASGTERPPVSEGGSFRAVTDSLAASIEDYGEQIELYREGTIGCPLLMSAREEAGRLFVRLSMFRLSSGARPDSVFRSAYRRFSDEMETVEATYRQTECPRPSTAAPAESVPGGPPLPRPAPTDSTPVDSVTPELEEDGPADSAGTDDVPVDSVGVRDDSLPVGQVGDTTPSGTKADSTPAPPSAPDSGSTGQPADTTATGA